MEAGVDNMEAKELVGEALGVMGVEIGDSGGL